MGTYDVRKWLKTRSAADDEHPPNGNVARPRPVRAVVVRDPTPWPADQPMWRSAHPIVYLAVIEVLALSVALSVVIHPTHGVYRAGVVVHLLSLAIGFGAVVLVDWHGILWLRGRRDLDEASKVAEAANPLIWTAIVGLLASATVLKPNLASELTWVKIAAVLLICLNGVSLMALPRTLYALAPRTPADLPARLRRRVLGAAAISHLGWWIAITIGIVTDIHRG